MPNRWVIPDIHGYIKTLQKLVESSVMPCSGDELYFLGDYIDRGPGSREVIDYVLSLQEGPARLFLLRGNHDQTLLKAREAAHIKSSSWWPRKRPDPMKAWLAMGGAATLKSFGAEKVDQIPDLYIEWLTNLGWYRIVDDFVLVHAGLNFDRNDPYEDREAMLWLRDYDIDRARIGGRRIIHGHVPVNLEMIQLSVTNPSIPFIDLDNGPYITGRPGFGNLCALELNTMKLVIQDNIDYTSTI